MRPLFCEKSHNVTISELILRGIVRKRTVTNYADGVAGYISTIPICFNIILLNLHKCLNFSRLKHRCVVASTLRLLPAPEALLAIDTILHIQ